MSSLYFPAEQLAGDRERRDLDDALTATRTRIDRDRLDYRELRDRTRQNIRGDRQALEGLRRERATDDAGVRFERESADLAQSEERSSSDARLARETQLRVDAEDRSRRDQDLEARRKTELEGLVVLVETQLEVVAARLAGMLTVVPRGAFEGQLSEGVAAIRAATQRMRQLLEDVLDPGDARCRDHDEGGSG